MTTRTRFGVALALLGAVARAQAQDPPKAFAIMGGTILTMGPQGTIEKGTILVKDGKITAVGKEVDLPSGLPVINATLFWKSIVVLPVLGP